MTDAATNLTTARDNYAQRLAEISANPKPNYNVEGTSYSWTDYQKMLIDNLERLNGLIDQMDGSDGIVEEITEML